MMVSPLEAVRAKPPASKLRMVEVATLVVPPSSVLMEPEAEMVPHVNLPVVMSYCSAVAAPLHVERPLPYVVPALAYPVTQRLPEMEALESRSEEHTSEL